MGMGLCAYVVYIAVGLALDLFLLACGFGFWGCSEWFLGVLSDG